jgi:hypothetical protein
METDDAQATKKGGARTTMVRSRRKPRSGSRRRSSLRFRSDRRGRNDHGRIPDASAAPVLRTHQPTKDGVASGSAVVQRRAGDSAPTWQLPLLSPLPARRLLWPHRIAAGVVPDPDKWVSRAMGGIVQSCSSLCTPTRLFVSPDRKRTGEKCLFVSFLMRLLIHHDNVGTIILGG